MSQSTLTLRLIVACGGCAVINIFSVDVEEIFHAEYTRRRQVKTSFFRTPKNIRYTLDFLDDQNITATFFVVGEIAAIFPEIFDMIKAKGHEIAFHGWSHRLLRELDVDSFRQELRSFRDICSDCVGYRAPSFSLNNNTKWSLNVLEEESFRYDSSLFPVATPLYGVTCAPIKPYKPSMIDICREDVSTRIYEFPVAVSTFARLRIPIAGGFWLRLLPAAFIRSGIDKLNRKGIPAVVYLHSWELDPETPRFDLGPLANFATYHNLAEAREKMAAVLHEHSFTSFVDYLNRYEHSLSEGSDFWR